MIRIIKAEILSFKYMILVGIGFLILLNFSAAVHFSFIFSDPGSGLRFVLALNIVTQYLLLYNRENHNSMLNILPINILSLALTRIRIIFSLFFIIFFADSIIRATLGLSVFSFDDILYFLSTIFIWSLIVTTYYNWSDFKNIYENRIKAGLITVSITIAIMSFWFLIYYLFSTYMWDSKLIKITFSIIATVSTYIATIFTYIRRKDYSK